MAGTSYMVVYKRAITEFKDPVLKNLLDNDTIMFTQVMYNFLENAISLFTNPFPAQVRVNNRVTPQLYTNTYISDGTTSQFTLTDFPDASLVDDCLFEYKIDEEVVGATYNSTTNVVTLSSMPPDGSTVTISIYYVGNWNITLYPMEEYLLGEFIVASWSEYIQNDKLDIIRLLGDTDFKLSAVSSTTTSKMNWNIVNKETVVKRMNKFAWDSQIQRLYP